jgi:hypothetical protein
MVPATALVTVFGALIARKSARQFYSGKFILVSVWGNVALGH